MTKAFHHKFFLKIHKDYEKGSVSIYLRITVAGKRAEISINRKGEPCKWISNLGRIKGNKETINAYLVSPQN